MASGSAVGTAGEKSMEVSGGNGWECQDGLPLARDANKYTKGDQSSMAEYTNSAWMTPFFPPLHRLEVLPHI